MGSEGFLLGRGRGGKGAGAEEDGNGGGGWRGGVGGVMGKSREDRDSQLTGAEDEYGGHCGGYEQDQNIERCVELEWEVLKLDETGDIISSLGGAKAAPSIIGGGKPLPLTRIEPDKGSNICDQHCILAGVMARPSVELKS